jgi:hypothetical protein
MVCQYIILSVWFLFKLMVTAFNLSMGMNLLWLWNIPSTFIATCSIQVAQLKPISVNRQSTVYVSR